MDKNLKGFLSMSLALLLSLFATVALFIYFYLYSTLNTYNYILLILMLMTIIITLLIILSVAAIFYTHKTGRTNKAFLWLLKIGISLVMPVLIKVSDIFKGDKDALRQLYIELNNIVVLSREKRYSKEDALVILPHCLQNSDCGYKITGDIGNCRRCGKCCVGAIVELMENIGVSTEIVTGGTAARNIISKRKPKVVLSVACERDLTSGIADVSGIPVIGILNDRPNGPCFNTCVNIGKIEEMLELIIKK